MMWAASTSAVACTPSPRSSTLQSSFSTVRACSERPRLSSPRRTAPGFGAQISFARRPSPCTRTLPVMPGRRTTTSPNVDRDISTPRDVAAGEHSRPQAVAGVAVVLIGRPGVPLFRRRLGPAAGGEPLLSPGFEEGLSDVLPRRLPLPEQSFVEVDGELPGVPVGHAPGSTDEVADADSQELVGQHGCQFTLTPPS